MSIIVEDVKIEMETGGVQGGRYSSLRSMLERSGIRVRRGILQSQNYVTGVSGWALRNIAGTIEAVNIIGANFIQTFVANLADIPTSIHIGDLWIVPDNNNKVYRSASVGADEITAGEWIEYGTLANWSELIDDNGELANVRQWFYQSTAPGSGMNTGDHWVDSDDNKLYRWSSSAWVEIQDDQIATAIANAATAQTAANDAQADATANDALLDDIADDTKITPVEKLTIKPLWDAIVAEKTDIDSEADTFGVSKTAYGTAYDSLDTYLNSTITVFGDMAATTNITRATWDAKWEAYFNSKIEILNAISTAAKALADAAQGTADIRITTFIQPEAPTALATGDVWWDSDDENQVYRWSSSAWVSAQDLAADWDLITGGTKPEDNATLQTSTDKTTGEDIADRNVLSMGHTGVDVGSTGIEDTWADEANAGTNYGTSAQMSVGQDAAQKANWGYVKIAIPQGITNSDISTVIIKFKVAGGVLGGGDDLTLRIRRLTSDPDEDAINWNARPTYDGGTAGTSSTYTSVPTGDWVEIDITQLFKDWNNGTYPVYGVLIEPASGASGAAYFNFWTKEASGDIQPRLDITGWADKDNVYKADSDDWEGVIQVIGFALEVKTSGNSIRIQTSGVLDGFTGLAPGKNYYVDTTAGGITTGPVSGAHQKKIGKAISATELDIDLDPPLEYVGINPVEVAATGGWTERDISAIVPKRAKIADFSLRIMQINSSAGVRKTDSGLNRLLATGSFSTERRNFNMMVEISEDVNGLRTVETHASNAAGRVDIVGYWI